MTDRNKALYLLLALLIAFVAGRYSGSAAGVTTKTEDTKDVKAESVEVKQHVRTEIVEQKDGTKKTIITTDTDTEDKKSEVKTDDVVIQTKAAPKVNLSLFAVPSLKSAPMYGISVSKEVLGPVTLGGFVLTNGTLGISIGLNF